MLFSLIAVAVMILLLYLLLRSKDTQTALSSLVTTFHVWPSVPVIIILLVTIILSNANLTFRRLIGEREGRNNRRMHRLFLNMIFPFVFGLFGLYYLITLTPESFLPTQQLSIIVISVAFAALPLAVITLTDLHDEDRARLLGITQKFILVVVLFTIFLVMTYMLDQQPFKRLDINYPQWNTINGWVIAISFLIGAFTYYSSVALFVYGTTDLIATFANINTRGNENTPTPTDQPQPLASPTQNQRTQQRSVHKKSIINVKILVWVIFSAGLIISLLLGILVRLLWPDTNDWSVPLSIEFGGLAISFPLIYLLINNALKNERRNRWEKVRSAVGNNLRILTISLLFQFDNKFSRISIVEFGNGNESIIAEAKRISQGDLVYNWQIETIQLDSFVATIEDQCNSIIRSISNYSFILDENHNLFEKILEMQNKMAALSEISSIRSINSEGYVVISLEHNTRINASFKQLLLAAIAVIEEIDQHQ